MFLYVMVVLNSTAPCIYMLCQDIDRLINMGDKIWWKFMVSIGNFLKALFLFCCMGGQSACSVLCHLSVSFNIIKLILLFWLITDCGLVLVGWWFVTDDYLCMWSIWRTRAVVHHRLSLSWRTDHLNVDLFTMNTWCWCAIGWYIRHWCCISC